MNKVLHILLVLLLVACSKKNDSTTPAITGTLSGTVSPAGAAYEVNIVTMINGQSSIFQMEPDAGGRFLFKDLPTGAYSITFSARPGYSAPDIIRADVSAGQEKSLGMISFLDYSKTGIITGTINPVNAATNVIATREDGLAKLPEAYASVNPFTGTFEFSRTLPGKYTLTFGNTLGFATEPLKSVSVTVDQRTDVGTINFRNSSSGSISGMVTPAAEVLHIWANYIGSYTKLYTIKPGSDGKFKIQNMSPGNYFIAAKTNEGSGFYAPYSRYYTVMESQDTNVGTITLTSTPPPLPISCKINNVLNEASYATALISPNRLTISSSLNGLAFAITINDFTEVSERTYTTLNGSIIFLGERKKPGPIGGMATIGYDKLWYANSTGTIRITAIDTFTKTISGTFNGTLVESKDQSNIKTITSGVFTNLQYR